MRLLSAVALLLAATFTLGASKPIVVFSRPADCVNEKLNVDPCASFEAAVKHPAMQRRLAAVDFETVIGDGETYMAVKDPGGREVMRWKLMPTWVNLGDILTLLDGAQPYLMRAYETSDPTEREREWALAVLAFGDRERGHALLQDMRSSQSPENRELAAIWLERLETLDDEAPLMKFARGGSSDRVRFEAWMAIGDLRVMQTNFEDAIDAYDRAATLIDNVSGRRSALAARQNATDLAVPVLGLGAPGTVIGGRHSIVARGVTKNVKSVEYRLDGKVVATAKRKPFAAGINFGRVPRRQVLEVVMKDARGNVVKRARTIVNERTDAFAVDIVQPSESELAGTVDVVVKPRVPSGRSIEELRVEWNGSRIARFTTPPYRTRFEARSEESGVLRAVLRLDDGSETEDVLLVNASTLVMESGAHLIEVPAYFDGAPAERDVRVTEAGKPREIEQIVRPEDAPLLVGLLIDSSGSMTEHMLDVQEAAVRFVEEHMEARDKIMLVTFDSTAQVRLRPTTDRALVERSILRMRPRGGTALHDAIITALLQMQPGGTRKALVVFSDGYDVSSMFAAGDAAEVARRAGVPIYVLAYTPELGPQAARLGRSAPLTPLAVAEIEVAKKELMAISDRTGGKAYDMTSLDTLGALWSEIGADLRKQSLVIYRTDSAGAEWRTLEISVKGKGAVRAPAGVYVTARE